ncbi:MAG: DUF2240 family protein [Thermoplasmata archaeon]|jgi:hypothetical protein
MEDLKRTISLLFRRQGRERMSERDFVLSASMDLRWFPPKEAQRLLDLSVQKGLVTVVEGDVEPTFDLDAVEVPLNFVPTTEVLQDAGDLFERILDAIAKAATAPRKDLAARVNGLQEGMGIYVEVAALLAARELEVDVSGFYPEVEARVREGRR